MATSKTENLPWGPTRLALLGYGLATTVGFIYAKAYYSSFDIDILNYVTPIDLLFISLENIDKVLFIAFLIVPIVLIWVAIGLPALLLAALACLAIGASVSSLILLAIAAAISFGVGVAINAARLLIYRFKCSSKALYEIWLDRRNRIRRVKKARAQRSEEASSEDDPVVQKEPLSFATAYGSAMRSSGPLKMVEVSQYVTKARDVIMFVPKVVERLAKAWNRIREEHVPRWRRIFFFEQGSWLRFKPLNALSWGPRLVVFSALAFLFCNVGWAAWRAGKVDALDVLSTAEDAEETNSNDDGNSADGSWFSESATWQTASFWFNHAGQAICPAVPKVPCPQPRRFRAIFVIPTENVASLEFRSMERKNGRSKADSTQDVGVSIRHGGREYERGCLTYVGATGSMQFFADLPSDQSDGGDGGCEGILAHANPVVVVLPLSSSADVNMSNDAGDDGAGDAKGGSDRERPPENTKGGEPETGTAAPGKAEDTEAPATTPTTKRGEGGVTSDERTRAGDSPGTGRAEIPKDGLTEGGAGDVEATADARTVVVVVGDAASPEYVRKDWLRPCDMEFAAWVGPFAEGAHDIGSRPENFRGCFKAVREVAPNSEDVMTWWREVESGGVQRLILVGRADREPISNDVHFSNFSLAQSRADWVKEQLSKAGAAKLHVLSIPGGPATPQEVDACDRVVEIHTCSGPAVVTEAEAEGSRTNGQSRQGAGGGGEGQA